jgi:hypothetical protein
VDLKMSKIRINASIDVTKLDKSRFFKGDKGTYCNITMLVDLNELDQYGNSGFITEAKKKDEPKDLRLPILGNTKIVWREEEQQQAPQQYQQQAPQQQAPDNFDDDIPF